MILTVHRRYYVKIKCQLDATDYIYCRFYCMLNMFRAIICPSSGAREYYTDGRCLWYFSLQFLLYQIAAVVWYNLRLRLLYSWVVFACLAHKFEVILTMHRRYHVEIKCQLDATDCMYCRFYCMLNMFREILCPSSGAREYYIDGSCL